jgi:acyl carrier protein
MKVKNRSPAFDDSLEKSGGVARRRESGAVMGGDIVAARKRSTVTLNGMSRRHSRATSALTLAGSRRTMNPTISMVDSQHADVIAVMAEIIRSVSAKAREVTITSNSGLLEELALDSLDLVAVILRLQDHYDVEIDPDEIPGITRVGDLVTLVTEELRSAA